MMRTAFKGNVILTDRVLEKGLVLIEGERIAAVFQAGEERLPGGVEIVDYGNFFVAPGLIDLHVHGASGKDVMDGSVESLKEIAIHQARCGVTGFVPAVSAAPRASILEAIAAVRAAQKEKLTAQILGVYLEGPFLSQAKKGAQDPDFIRPANKEDAELLLKAADGIRTILTIAPEVGDNLNFIPILKDKGMIVAIGHSEASYELARQSFDLGVTHATHLFNAMSGFLPREPGVIGAVLDRAAATAELIADGVHVHPASLRLAIRCKGPSRVCLVTDSMKAAGLGDGSYRVGKREVILRDGQARLKENGALAGSVLTLDRAVKNIIVWAGVSVSEAVNMASFNPARLLGLEETLGSIDVGKTANLTIFDQEFRAIDTIVCGRLVLRDRRGT
ncbi:MAG: N-acetylglucosamine-6-phosphate deacetylase [Clostridiales bacterium]|nr:N-acetylglucosamine-6-phosphate deacetylase [Clostridiales bacterium]